MMTNINIVLYCKNNIVLFSRLTGGLTGGSLSGGRLTPRCERANNNTRGGHLGGNQEGSAPRTYILFHLEICYVWPKRDVKRLQIFVFQEFFLSK